MHQTFYEFLMTKRDSQAHDEISNFAKNVFLDHSFPKQSKNYHEITEYLELNGNYLVSMDIFDDAWKEFGEN